jgi:hypothetical protein
MSSARLGSPAASCDRIGWPEFSGRGIANQQEYRVRARVVGNAVARIYRINFIAGRWIAVSHALQVSQPMNEPRCKDTVQVATNRTRPRLSALFLFFLSFSLPFLFPPGNYELKRSPPLTRDTYQNCNVFIRRANDRLRYFFQHFLPLLSSEK